MLSIMGITLGVVFIIGVTGYSIKIDKLEKKYSKLKDSFLDLDEYTRKIVRIVYPIDREFPKVKELSAENEIIGEVYAHQYCFGVRTGLGKWVKFTEDELQDRHRFPCNQFKINDKWVDGKQVIIYKDYSPIENIKREKAIEIMKGDKNETNADTPRPKRGNKSTGRTDKGK